ncbi:TetR/AcrR family transcriptional regulator [Treponema sp. Marseille-Q4132]|uniref:TetR/AcrR family transcriptional regulator n=1 Tax=Treponema sp. Marseille-Q4132 TaxID=2766701 RepID=UPI001652EF2D|nr:TetR/AcrR family transcriptional regulator [Treponema sp. Marseille-Q4132]QNL97608.1 TetR/AcrR family transcriptional regulator [Treponema sp. Marseille-Q4132]
MSKLKLPYHREGLKNLLIEKGIEIVNTDGVQSFSLRKAAAACKVSHAAPYSHFHNKEELLNAMQLHITERFSKTLETAVTENKKPAALLKKLGIAYVSFFIDNPAYFQFLYSSSDIKVDLTLSIPDEKNYKPFILYKNSIVSLLRQTKVPKKKQNDILITIWAFIHGLTALAAMKNVHYDKNWKEKITDFMDLLEPSFLK